MKKVMLVSVPVVFIILLALFIGIGSDRKESNDSAGTKAVGTEADVTKAAVTEQSVSEIAREYVQNMKKGGDLWSSNPYDHVDMEYYDKIVALGFDAIEVLEEERAGGGLYSWVAGALISDITRCDVGDWDTGQGFFQLWDGFCDSALDDMTDIITDDISIDKKVKKLKKFGIFGEAFLEDVLSHGKTSKMINKSVDVKLELSDVEKEKLGKIVTSDSSELEKARTYLLERCK